MPSIIARPAVVVAVALGLATSGCSTISGLWGGDKPPEGQPGHIAGFLGAVAADEPQAALVARQVLSSGGNAADATVAGMLAMAVTLPSRAGLGAGGACLALRGDPKAAGVPEAILFMPQAPAQPAGAERPAAVPMLARGLFLLGARYGKARFETLVTPAEQLAREGTRASRALLRDLAVVAGPLAGDPSARATFFHDGRPLAEGDMLVQPELAATLAELRRAGAGDLYAGELARQLVAASELAGGGLAASDLRGAVPKAVPALVEEVSGEATVSFLPLPADGGLAAAAAFKVLSDDVTALDAAKAQALAAAATFRRQGGDAMAILKSGGSGSLPSLPASASFAVLDSEGNAVVCAVTMGNLFGTGRMAAGTGIVFGASPAWRTPPLLAAGMVTYRRNCSLQIMAGGSGQDGAPVAVALALARGLKDRGASASLRPDAAPEPGRSNLIGCTHGPSEPESCGWASDPRGFGYATSSN